MLIRWFFILIFLGAALYAFILFYPLYVLGSYGPRSRPVELVDTAFEGSVWDHYRRGYIRGEAEGPLHREIREHFSDARSAAPSTQDIVRYLESNEMNCADSDDSSFICIRTFDSVTEEAGGEYWAPRWIIVRKNTITLVVEVAPPVASAEWPIISIEYTSVTEYIDGQ